MLIANPIYDVVFEFMMEDEKVAAALISAIIEEEVLSLEPARIEYAIPAAPASRNKKKPKKKKKKAVTITNYTVCRLGFSAHISVPGGQKTVHIEMQKAKFASDIMRFRRNIGALHQSSSNVYKENKTDMTRHIYCIFLIEQDIDLPDHPIVCADSRVTDAVTNDVIEISSNRFIDSLHHRSRVIRINWLRKRHRNDLERLLDVFDQKHRWSDDAKFLNVNDAKFPKRYRSVFRRLSLAVVNREIMARMEAEYIFLEDARKWERENARKDKIIEEYDKMIEVLEALEEKDRTLEELDRVLEEKDRTLEEIDKALEEKDKYIKELESRFAEMQRTTL
ncbi:MAG: hypothetical protein LBD35_05875 [Prevotellaceae bacterium]|jgi:hypothetical protein|nr:hypothetical protein [Prevotellaceae bacterium]